MGTKEVTTKEVVTKKMMNESHLCCRIYLCVVELICVVEFIYDCGTLFMHYVVSIRYDRCNMVKLDKV